MDDDGIGMEEENIVSALDNPSDEKLQPTVKGSIGLKNLKERLEIIYGEKGPDRYPYPARRWIQCRDTDSIYRKLKNIYKIIDMLC